MREAFPPRTQMCAPHDPKVPYARLTELVELARVTFADASAISPVFYDGQPLVEVYANGSARVFTREHVLAQMSDEQDLALEVRDMERMCEAERELEFADALADLDVGELESAFARWPEDFTC